MKHSDQPSVVPQRAAIGQRAAACLVCLSLIAGHIAPALAAPAQIPLINRPENTPNPNFMLTLDDSGSMTYQYLPERPFVLNGQSVNFPSDGKVFIHPEEIAANIFTGTGRVAGEQGGTDTNFVTATLNDSDFDRNVIKLYQLQMRSPQVNRIYYNPALKYQPWSKVDGTLWPNASKTAANLDPRALDPAGDTTASRTTVDLTNTTKKYSIRWYCGPNVGSPSYFQCDSDTAKKKSFNPAIFYLLADQANPNTATVGNNNYRLYNLNDGQTTALVYPKAYPNRTDCVVSSTTTTCDRTAEWTNFANWFVYYRSRLLIAKASIPDAFNSLTDNIRLGWGTIHSGNYNIDGVTSPIVQQGVRDLSETHKATFTQWIRKLGTYAGTPSKDAIYAVGQYFKRQDNRSPWSTDMVNGTPLAQQLQCRRSFNILVTDGYYLASNTTLGNIDSIKVDPSTTSSNQYTPAYPFMDSSSNTLADFAMEFWKNDLQPSISDKVKPIVVLPTSASPTALDNQIAQIKSDPATWQHLTQFMVGFGVTGTIDRTDENLGKLANCGALGGLCWPPNPGNEIDDLWHAAINSRGEYFDVNTPEDLKAAIKAAVARGTLPILKEAGLATAASTLITGNVKFVPEYTPGSWIGNVRAFPLDLNGKAGTTELWTGGAEGALPAPANRNIQVWDGAAHSAYPFSAAAVVANTRTKNLLGTQLTSTDATNLVNYLRGDPVSNAGFRERTGKLPDFVNSTPLFIKGGSDLGYSKLPAAQGGGDIYTTYYNIKSGVVTTAQPTVRTKGALFIGGNGGMMHVFDGGTGVETFGFIPETSVSNLSKLAQRTYGTDANPHQYFVDGPLVESDVYVTSASTAGNATSAWTNMVFGTMGAGGRSIFALKLNLIDPTSLSASSPVWETTAAQSNDLGYITSEPQVGVLPNGQWKVFVGNGMDSNSGNAALLVLDAQTGAVESVVAYTANANDATTKSGLGGVRLIKNTLGQVIAAYAGDARGNLWRFEYDSANNGHMVVGYQNAPLFRAFGPDGATQPIMAAPLVVSNGNNRGQTVVFGTGRLLYESDSSDTSTQTVYGVVDTASLDQRTSSTSSNFSLTSADRNQLVQQTITTLTTVQQLNANGTTTAQTKTFIDVVTNPATTTRTQGWLMDLSVPQSNAINSAQDHPKAIYPVQIFGGYVLITAVQPASTTDSCNSALGAGYAFFLNALTGNKSVQPALDANGNGTIESGDGNYAGWVFEGGPQAIIPENPSTTPGNKCHRASIQSANGDILVQNCDDPQLKTPIADRVWRQLFNPPHP